MGITELSIKRPVTIMMVVLALVVLGYKSMKMMPVDLFPKIEIPYISIITVYRGAGPQEVETLLSKPIEESVSSVNRVKSVRSVSQEGVSTVIIEFSVGADLDVAASDVRDKLDIAKATLPADSDDPIIYKLDLNAEPVMYIGMSGNRPPSEVKKMADDIVKDRFGKVDGVASVGVSGGDTREIYVKVDQDRLKAHGFNIMEITQALAQNNLNIPAGNIRQGRHEFSVRVVGEYTSVDELQETKIRHSNPMFPGVVELKDLATVLDTNIERQTFSRLEGRESVGIIVQKQADANTVKVADGVNKEIENLKKILPPDILLSVSRDNSTFIRESLDDVTKHLFEGALLATLVVFLFLHVFRATFIILLAIPTSIMASFILLSAFGFTLNMMTLMGLALSVGILVDDSIVVLENIFRHLVLGESPHDAALNGRMEIGGAAVAITLTDVVVFVPIAFMGGIVGQFFKQFGITVATVTMLSLFVSFTLTPMLASKWLRAEDALASEGHEGDGDNRRRGFFAAFFRAFDRGFHSLSEIYRGSLAWSLRHRWTVVIVGNLLLIASFYLVKFMGFEFFPHSDEGQFDVSIEMPVGTRVTETNRITALVENYIQNRKKYPEVESVFSSVGSVQSMMGAGKSGPQYSAIQVRLVEKKKRERDVWKIMSEISKEVAEIPGPTIRVAAVDRGGGSGEAPLYIEVTGSDNLSVTRTAERVQKIVDKTTGARDSDVSWKLGKPEYQVHVDRLRAAQYGMSVAQIAMTLRGSIEGNTDTKYREKGDEYDIHVRLGLKDRKSREDIENIMLGGAMGKNVLLKDVADVRFAEGPTKLERKNRQRCVVVSAQLAPGYQLGNVSSAIQKDIDKLDKPAGTNVVFAGEAERMKESGGNMFSALGLAILLVYILMSALFESLLYPFVIMFALPQALIGGLWALFLWNKSLSMISMIGIIMLVGLVTKNGILLVDYTNTLRKRGKSRDEALIESGPTRLRPILMTTLTVILGNLPIAMGLGSGSEMRSPMSAVVIGGLTLSMFLTLLIIPCVYSIMDDFSNFITRVFSFGKKPSADIPAESTEMF